MGQAGGKHGFHGPRGLEPLEERGHLIPEALGRRSAVVDALAADRARDDLHRSVCVVAPLTDEDPAHAAIARREQGGVPREQPLFGQGRSVVPGSIERHLDNTVDIAVRRRQSAGVQPEAAREGRAHLVGGKDFALDLAGFHDILGEHAQGGIAAHLETQSFHAAEQLPLGVARVREELAEPSVILPELRPFGALPDEHQFTPHVVR